MRNTIGKGVVVVLCIMLVVFDAYSMMMSRLIDLGLVAVLLGFLFYWKWDPE